MVMSQPVVEIAQYEGFSVHRSGSLRVTFSPDARIQSYEFYQTSVQVDV